MNTKLLLLLAFLLIANTTFSIVISKEKTTSAPASVPTKEMKQPHQDAGDLLWTIDFHTGHNPLDGNNHHPIEKAHTSPEDDNKFHRYHFSRISTKRSRRFFLFMSKLVLVIAHICCLVYCFMHACH